MQTAQRKFCSSFQAEPSQHMASRTSLQRCSCSLSSKGHSPCPSWRMLLRHTPYMLSPSMRLCPLRRIHPVVCRRLQHGAAAHAETHHEHGSASMPGQGHGTDRNHGGGRQSGSQESRMAGPKHFSSGHQRTVLLESKQSLYMAMQVTRALHIFCCCSGTGAVAAQHKMQIRPYTAEPHVYGSVEAAF